MKKSLYILYVCAGLMAFTSCSDFLDRQSAAYESDGFYKSPQALEQGVTAVYKLVPYDQNWAVPPTMVQDIYTAYGLQETENTTIGAGAGLTPNQGYVNTYWANHWKIIGRANSVIDGALTDRDEMTDGYKQHLAEVKVLRAYAYYNLMTTFGDIPFFMTSVTPDKYKCERTDKKDVTDAVVADLTEIAESEDLAWTGAQRGRVDRATVYALISRYCLFAGSLDFGGEAQNYFQKAADAAAKVMEHRGLANNFADLFTLAGQKKADVRDEMLWELSYSAEGRINRHRTRFGHTARVAGGSSVRFPSQLLVDTYEAKDGLRIDESKVYDNHRPTLNRDARFRQTLLGHGDTMQYSNDGGATINKVIINAYDDVTRFYPNPRRPGTWGNKDNVDITGTSVTFARHGSGWLWNKYNEDIDESFAESSCDISIIRVAEVYLTFAEAMIELGKYTDPLVVNAINAVRTRAGQPAIDANGCVTGETLGGLSVQDKLRQRVRRERKVELAMEGVIFTDVRRWQIGDIVNEFPSYGNPVKEIRYEGLADTDIPTYKTSTRHDINDVANYEAYKEKLRVRDRNRYWAPQFQWWPIPQTDVDRNPNLTNTAYE